MRERVKAIFLTNMKNSSKLLLTDSLALIGTGKINNTLLERKAIISVIDIGSRNIRQVKPWIFNLTLSMKPETMIIEPQKLAFEKALVIVFATWN